MLKNTSLVIISLLVSSLAACNSGSTASTYQYLQVVPSSIPPIYKANTGQTASIVFTNTIVSNLGSPQAKYNITATVPNSQFTVLTNESGNNGCTQVTTNQACDITIVFTPNSAANYSSYNPIQFTVGILESTINVITAPNSY